MAWKRNKTPANAEMPFLDHLEELRMRLFYCAGALVVGLIVAFVIFKMIPGFDPIEFIDRPILPYLQGRKPVYMHPGEAFQLVIDVAFFLAFVVASPVIIYQIWAFVSPAMYAHEKKIALPVVFGIVFLFVCGVALAFELILPLTLKFLLNVESNNLTPMIDMSENVGFEIYMCVAFGAAFELPIVIMGLTAIGVVQPDFLAKYRRYAAVGVLIAGGFITPDPTSMFVIAIPLYGLYELSIMLSRMVYRWRLRRDAAGDRENGPPGPPPPSRYDPLRLGTP